MKKYGDVLKVPFSKISEICSKCDSFTMCNIAATTQSAGCKKLKDVYRSEKENK